MKVNIDDSFLGSSGRGGIGGDVEGWVLLLFGKEVCVDLAACRTFGFEGGTFGGGGIAVDIAAPVRV